jgi:hypothetical protein
MRKRTSRKKLKEIVARHKENNGCKICGETHVACLDFHHRDFEKKRNTISDMVYKQWPAEKIIKEMKKCDILCSNCHRKVHYEESTM